jgi:NurA domain
MPGPDETPFADLPAALVEEVLAQTAAVGDLLLTTFRRIKVDRARYRDALVRKGLIRHDSSLGHPPLPTTCGTDGSYAVERLLVADLAAAAAVAVEGLTPPSEVRHWEQPRHSTFMAAEVHHEETQTILRAVMLGQELLLAARAPHDLVMIDMTLTLPLIYFNQALNEAPANRDALECAGEFVAHCAEYLDAYRTLLRAERSDRNYVGLPKYSTRREIGVEMGWPGEHDDRGLLSLLLQSGELTDPRPLAQPAQRWHLNTAALPAGLRQEVDLLAADVVAQLEQVHVFYYRPQEWLPALRVEVAPNTARNPHRLASVVQGLKHQCATPGMLEPYPLYLADRTVKALARSLPAFRQVATQRISEHYDGDIAEIFFGMHGYRSEAGR